MKRPYAISTLFAGLILIAQTGFTWESVNSDVWSTSISIEHPAIDPRSTYQRLLPLAEAGDPDVQNMLGFMYFYSEGVEMDYDKAHFWFHQAAEQGNEMAQRNLGLFHSQSWSRIPTEYFAPVEANFWFSVRAASMQGGSPLASRSYHTFLNSIERDSEGTVQHKAKSGQEIYLTFCAGCHGFEGSASYPQAPSLRNGDIFGKSDEQLLNSILNGKNTMPAWLGTIEQSQARSVLSYMRSRHAELESHGDTAPDSLKEAGPAEDQGEYIYTRFCGGCHGFNGISYYVNSPSFALRHRMEKSDMELSRSIAKGLGVMPSWENMLNEEQIDSVLQFVRSLATTYESGIDHDIRVAPELYFLFRPLGEADDAWHVRRDR